MTMNDEYWKLSRRIGDVVTQELLKGYCVKDKTLLIQQILQLPFVKIDQPKQLPRQHGIYFVVESELIVYIGKATGEGFYGRWFEPLPRLKLVGFRHQTGIAVKDCLTSPTPMVELPTILIFAAALTSLSLTEWQDGQRQRLTDKSSSSRT